jgi:class 3 adenylate cyclase
MSPSRADDAALRDWFARHERMGASPGTALEASSVSAQTDVRDVLESISVPTLLIHRVGDRVADIGGARYMAARIPHAKLVELPGEDHWIGTAGDEIIDIIEEFVTGRKPGPPADRVLASILFTDIVSSTERAVAVGDARWRTTLDRHDQITAGEVERHRGVLVKRTGDGVLATFDGPARAIACATALRDAMSGLGIQIRAGVHVGEIEVRGIDMAGVAVHLAARVMAEAEPDEVLVSRTVTDLVAGSGHEFVDRGERELKGFPGRWQLYAVSR